MLLSRICLLFGLAAVCEGKDWRGSARMSPSKPWVPLTSFAFDLGAGKVCIFYLSLVWSRLLPQLLVSLVSSDGRLEQCVTLSLLRVGPVSSDELHCCTQLERIGSTCISHARVSNLYLSHKSVSMLFPPTAIASLLFFLIPIPPSCTNDIPGNYNRS